MPTGIQVIGDAGTIQIDQDYFNFGLKSSGSISMTLDGASHPQAMRIGNVALSAVSPILAIQPPNGYPTSIYNVSYSGGTWTFYLRCRTDSNFSVNYWLYDKASNAAGISDTYGLQIFDASGNTVFHSGMKGMRVVGVLDNSTTTLTLTSGRTYAMVQGMRRYVSYLREAEDDHGAPPFGRKWMELLVSESACHVNSNVVTGVLNQFEYSFTDYPLSESPSTTTYGDNLWWVVDVTNH